jgi:hypothetical protein
VKQVLAVTNANGSLGLLASLHLPETQERFDQVDEAYENTCEWIFKKEELGFVEWLRSGRGIFWISGKPGSGKSTLMKFVVSSHQTFQYLYMNRPDHRLIWAEFFFSNRGKRFQKNLEGLYHQILYQLVNQADYLTRIVQPIFEDHAEVQGTWTLIYLEAAMLSIVRQREVKINICLFIDALDEQDESYALDHRRLVDTLNKLIAIPDDKFVRVMLCVSSRPETLFMDAFSRWPGIRIHENTQQDVHFYVKGRLKAYLESRDDLAANPQAVASLQSTFDEVIARAQGVFLWVKLVTTDLIEGLMDGDSPGQIQRRLSSIPGDGDLHDLYHLILLSLKKSYLVEAFIMLQIAYATVEPLSAIDFFEAVDYIRGCHADFEWEPPSQAEVERKLLSRCRGFLEVQTASWQDQENQEHIGKIVQFLHQSVKDYLAQEKSFETIRMQLGLESQLNGHVYLLKFLTWQHLQKYKQQPSLLKSIATFDFRKFGVLYQARMVEDSLGVAVSGPLDALADFVDRYELAASYLRIEGWKCPLSWHPNFLAVATQAGLLLYVEQALVKLGGPKQISGRPLLHYAAMPLPSGLCTSHTDPFIYSPDMIKLLKRLGADLEAEFEGSTAFGWVFREFTKRSNISQKQFEILRTLLIEGSNPNVLVEGSLTALQIAVRNSDRQLAKLLLNFDAQFQKLTSTEWTYLERYNKPMSIVNAFRNGQLRARDMDEFKNFFEQDEPERTGMYPPSQWEMQWEKYQKLQKLKNLLKQYPPGVLVIREEEVYVVNYNFVLEHENTVNPLLKLFNSQEFEGTLPKPLVDCSLETRLRVLRFWAITSVAIDYW